MTAGGNGDRGRITEHVEGQVERANERGVKLAGHADYVNFSKYASPPIAPPRRGASVRLGLDADGFVRELQVLDASQTGTPDHDADRSREIRRQVAMKAAATITAAALQSNVEARADHVFPLAERILTWLEQAG